MPFAKVYSDEIGRCFCEVHRKDHCNICCMSFIEPNIQVEEQAGLRRPSSKVEELAKSKVMLERGLAYMMEQDPQTRRTMQENIDYHESELARVNRELQELQSEGDQHTIAKAVAEEVEKGESMDADNRALASAFAKLNPGKTEFHVGGEETQKIYDQFVAPPPSSQREQALDPYTCTYCRKNSTTKLMACARCKKQAYCGRDCQKSHWKAHQKECVPVEKLSDAEEKQMPLTWKQLEEFQIAQGERLEVRFMEQEPGLRQIAVCKDRVGLAKRVAAYTESRRIPGFVPGKVMVWKTPRFHSFADESSGARIEESDLVNIKIKD